MSQTLTASSTGSKATATVSRAGKRSGTWCEIAPKADPHNSNLFRINARRGEREVNHRGDDLLPIRTKRQTLAMNRPVLETVSLSQGYTRDRSAAKEDPWSFCIF